MSTCNQSILDKPYFHDEVAAFSHLEGILWHNGAVCPHCGGKDRIYELKGKSTRVGLKKCGHCRKQFTVKIGTVFESSHIPLHKWLQAFYLMTSGKKSISINQLHQVLEVTYKTAWHMNDVLSNAIEQLNIFSSSDEKLVTLEMLQRWENIYAQLQEELVKIDEELDKLKSERDALKCLIDGATYFESKET